MNPSAHLFVSLITALSLLFIARLVRRREMAAKYALLWLSIGLVMLVLAVSPLLLDRVSDWLGVAYAPATLFVAAIVLLLLLSVHYSYALSRLEDRTRTLAEEIAFLRLALEAQEGDDPDVEPASQPGR